MKKKLKDGDILNIDVTVIKDGYFGDNSKMYMVGEPPIRSKVMRSNTTVALSCIAHGKTGHSFK